MRTLLILRHAKSSWKEPGLTDHDRPLNKRGQRDAPRVGELLDELDLVPQQIFSSDAVRAATTARMVAQACRFDLDLLDITPHLYLATPDTYIQYVQRHGEGEGRVLVVGHNPGLEGLLHVLTGVDEHLPTAALAEVRLDIDDWSAIHRDAPGELIRIWRPKDHP
jgi:phosphohistidine phosphatase